MQSGDVGNIYTKFDEELVARTRGIDWHGNDRRILGSEWNQWEKGAGTGGGKVRAYKTDEYIHGENLHSSDESHDSEGEVPADKKTLADKRRDKEKMPGIYPAPEVSNASMQ